MQYSSPSYPATPNYRGTTQSFSQFHPQTASPVPTQAPGRFSPGQSHTAGHVLCDQSEPASPSQQEWQHRFFDIHSRLSGIFIRTAKEMPKGDMGIHFTLDGDVREVIPHFQQLNFNHHDDTRFGLLPLTRLFE